MACDGERVFTKGFRDGKMFIDEKQIPNGMSLLR